MEEPQHANAKSVIHGITSMVSPRYIQLSFAKLFWIFVVGSILGLLIEDVFHVFTMNGKVVRVSCGVRSLRSTV